MAGLVAVFEEVKRVLRPDGVVFCNLADSYAGSGKGPTGHNGIGDQEQRQGFSSVSSKSTLAGYTAGSSLRQPILGGGASAPGVKPKSLFLIPQRFAIAMQEAGWIVRDEIVWAKKSAMPESIRDRCTKAWEPIYMFTKSGKYFWDQTALANAVKVDDDAVSQVKFRRGNETLPELRSGSTLVGVLSAERSPEDRVQEVRACPYHGVEANGQGEGFRTRDGQEVQRQRAREGQASGVQPFGDTQRGESSIRADRGGSRRSREVSADRQAQSGEEAALRERQGESLEQSLSADTEGARVVASRGSQETSVEDVPSAADEHSDRSRMGSHQSGLSGCLCVLRKDGPPSDSGSHYPVVEGGASRQGEHRASVPIMQQPEEQPRVASPNARNVWALSPEPSRLSHWASYPTEIPRRCILAATSEKGQCPACGAPWVRVVGRDAEPPSVAASGLDRYGTGDHGVHRKVGGQYQKWLEAHPIKTLDWQPSCACDAGEPVPQLVLDPFLGTGTTALVADRLGRNAVGIELNAEYVEIARRRLSNDAGMFAEIEVAASEPRQLTLEAV